jgi:signal transduction histidine kinase
MDAYPVLSGNGEGRTISAHWRNDPFGTLESSLHERILTAVKVMAHDTQDSLVSMAAMIKRLRRRCDVQKDAEFADRLDELLMKAVGLIGITEEYLIQILSLVGDLEPEKQELDLLGDVIKPVLEELSPHLKGYEVQIRNPLGADPGDKIPVRGDRIWLKAVFRNLLKNARKYGDNGGAIELDFEDQGSYHRVKLFNSGKPIPREDLAQLFSPFQNKPRENENKGMGLGLYLIRKIIEKHGGAVWYEPMENGSNFVFTLPWGGRKDAEEKA